MGSFGGERARWRAVRTLPATAWAMSLLLLGGAARCMTGVTSPLQSGVAGRLVTASGLVCLSAAVSVLVAGSRLPRAVGHGLLVWVFAVTTLLVATSATRAGVVLSAFAYPWGALYAAHFMSRRVAYAYAALASAGFAVGVTVAGPDRMFGVWLLVTVTVAAVTGATAALVDALRRQSETDALTGVVNRAGFERLARHALASSTRRGQPTALVVCDLDGLKLVNDSAGHAAGDALLAACTSAWLAALRGGDVLARLGGDEFAVLLPDTDRAGAEIAVRRLRDATGAAFSAGIAVSEPGESLDALLSRADAAMYAAKHAGTRPRGSATGRRRPVVAPRP